MKRLICAVTALALLLCGCGGGAQEAQKTAEAATTTTAETTTRTTVTTEVTTTMITTTESAESGTSTSAGTTETTTKTTVKRPTLIKPIVTTSKKATTTTTAASRDVTLLEPADGALIETQAPVIDRYLAITDEEKAAEFWQGSYYHMAKGATFVAAWESAGNLWKVYFSEDKQFTGVDPIMTTEQWIQIGGLMPGHTYYWKVVNTYGVSSEVRSVTMKETTVRWIDADGGDNIRDLGGWKTEDGKTVKYGLLYRGACIDGYNGGALLTQKGCSVFKRLGIRSEFDLRGSDVKLDGSAFGGNYFKVTMTQYDYIFDSKQTKTSLGKIFSMLSNPGFYPVYYHCNGGADRAGTLSFLINGLLGVSYADLTRDFELTCFSGRGKRLRSKLNEETGLFEASGVMQNGGGNYIAWGPLYKTMMAEYGTGSGKLSDAIANFLIKECGVTQKEIDAVRSIMLE